MKDQPIENPAKKQAHQKDQRIQSPYQNKTQLHIPLILPIKLSAQVMAMTRKIQTEIPKENKLATQVTTSPERIVIQNKKKRTKNNQIT